MCRLAAWLGQPIPLEDVIVRPAHSLLEQSHAATEAKLRTNGDGFGIAWYGCRPQERGPLPGQFRDVLPAWSDGNLPSLCRMIESPLFLAHVRASTLGETSRANCHPFVHGRWSFMHNGQIPHIVTSRRTLEATLPDDLYEARRGTTDSELLFLLMLANGLDADPPGAVARTLAQIDPFQRPDAKPTRLTCVFSNGEHVFAFRHASDQRSPGLYAARSERGTVLASEPLDGDTGRWSRMPDDQLAILSASGIAMQPLLAAPENYPGINAA